MTRYLGTKLMLFCQKIDCDAEEAIDVDATERGLSLTASSDVAADWPDGWGWDFVNGVDEVLHCPEHRTTGKAVA